LSIAEQRTVGFILAWSLASLQKTVELVTRNFWWLGVTKEVKWYMEGCDACQQNKNYTEQLAEKSMPNSILEKPWAHILVNFITKLPLAQGYDSILVVVDQLTKMVHFIPTTEKILAEGLARLFRDNVMNIEWDYGYYQPWSDNEWLVDEIMALLNEDIIMQ